MGSFNVTEFTVTVADVLEGDNATVSVTLVGIDNQTLNATVTVIVNNKPITVTVTDGEGSEVVENLTRGKYPVVAMLTNCPKYNDAINSTVFYVKGQSKLTIDELTTAVYGEDIEITINLTDSNGNPINGIVVINETIQVLVENGIGKFGTIEGSHPDVGEYYFNAVYEGDEELFGCLDGFTVNVTQAGSKVTIDTIADNYGGNVVITFNIENETDFVTVSISNVYTPDIPEEYNYTDGKITAVLPAGTYIVKIHNGENGFYTESQANATFNVYDNVVTNDTFFAYFDKSGNLRDVVPFDELIFKGEFSDLTDYVITIDKTISIAVVK